MFIQTEETPNPATLKFLPGQTVLGTGTANFSDGDNIESSPLAKKLFNVEGVVGVFLGSDFITITKKEDFLWEHIKPALLGTIMDFLQSGEEILSNDSRDSSHEIHEGPDSEIIKKITDLLDTRVRPAVAQDGGDITFQSFQEGGEEDRKAQGRHRVQQSTTATMECARKPGVDQDAGTRGEGQGG